MSLRTFNQRTFAARTFNARTFGGAGGDGVTAPVDGGTAGTRNRLWTAQGSSKVSVSGTRNRLWIARAQDGR